MNHNGNYIKILGTAGARFSTTTQLRDSGGTWISYKDTNILIDPGPGSLVKCLESDPKLDPSELDAIIVTHKHIDHSNDINIMIEAMTHGGSKKRGKVFAPNDLLEGDTILLDYLRDYPQKIATLEPGGNYSVKNVKFSSPIKHQHGVEAYGLKFNFSGHSISFIVDTKYFDGLVEAYQADTIFIYTLLMKSIDRINHLSLEDAKRLISSIKPKRAVLTHFGTELIKNEPEQLAEDIARKCHVEVQAAFDGMVFLL